MNSDASGAGHKRVPTAWLAAGATLEFPGFCPETGGLLRGRGGEQGRTSATTDRGLHNELLPLLPVYTSCLRAWETMLLSGPEALDSYCCYC